MVRVKFCYNPHFQLQIFFSIYDKFFFFFLGNRQTAIEYVTKYTISLILCSCLGMILMINIITYRKYKVQIVIKHCRTKGDPRMYNENIQIRRLLAFSCQFLVLSFVICFFFFNTHRLLMFLNCNQ